MRKIGKKYTPEEEKAMDELFIAQMHELYTNFTDIRDEPYPNEYNTNAEKALNSYKKMRRELISNIALEIARFYHEYHDNMTETHVGQFIENIVPLVKRDAQNTLYDIETETDA